MEGAADVIRDVGKHTAVPIAKFVNKNQKMVRKMAVKLIDVETEKDKNPPTATGDKAKETPVENGNSSLVLESMRHWDVSMPPVKRRIKFGVEVPNVKNKMGLGKLFSKKRRITIELYKKVTPDKNSGHTTRERRVFDKLAPRASVLDIRLEDEDSDSPLDDEDSIIFRILKQAKQKKGLFDIDDDDSQSTMPNGVLESTKLTTYNVKDYGDGQDDTQVEFHWKERYRVRLAAMEINHMEGVMVEIKMGLGDDFVVRDIYFDNPHEVQTFVRTYQKMRELQHERGSRIAAEHRLNQKKKLSPSKQIASRGNLRNNQRNKSGLRSFMIGNSEPNPDIVNLLVEIVSANNLPIADIVSSDPYVCVEDGRKQWHETGVVSKSLNPIWTLSTGSLFLIQTTLGDFFENARRIEFIVKDYDTVGDNDILGSVLVPKSDLLAGKGERLEYTLNVAKYGHKVVGNKKSYLTLRSRSATPDDIKFLRTYEAKKKSGLLANLGMISTETGIFADDCYLPPRTHPSTTHRRQEKPSDNGIAPSRYRLKPFADPSRPETKWMTKKEILREADDPSVNWIEAGSGNVGKFYLEILGCDGLPNLDHDPTGRNKSDPFVCIVFEDSVVNTDVINDCLSPRWMPWTQRAFVFNVMHPSSQLYISVMDHDGPMKKHHEKIGRCVVNPTNTRTGTVYTLRYSLLSADTVDRKVRGKIIFRYRFETSTERQFLLSSFQLKKEYSVSTNGKKDSHTIGYALTNDYDRYALSLETIQKYWDEIAENEIYIDDIYDGLLTVILWRGHFPLTFSFFKKSFTFKLPFHSVIAFTWGVVLANDFEKFGSFFCFCIAWVLFATLEQQRRNPNPWKRPRTYVELLFMVLFNKCFVHPEIKENENIEDIIRFDKDRNEEMTFRKDAIETMRVQNELDFQHMEKERKELDKQAHDDAANFTIGANQLILAPFQDLLIPVQITLYRTCIYLRVAKSIITWRDSVSAFWIASIALSLSVLLYDVPWYFIFFWAFRILVYVFLGPWMKLVDIFFVENTRSMTTQERKLKVEQEMNNRYQALLGESKIRRLLSEHKVKMRDMERYMFGQYGARVPIFKEERFDSIPLAGGSAVPYDPKKEPPPNIIRRINGQLLTGNMIPQRQNPAREFKARQKELENIPKEISTDFPLKDEMMPLLEVDEEDPDESRAYGAV